MSLSVSGPENILKIIADNDPRKAVEKVLADLHKALAEINKLAEKEKGVARDKAKLIAKKLDKLFAGLSQLKFGGEFTDILIEGLKAIKDLDPDLFKQIISANLQRTIEVKALKAKIANAAIGGIVV
ncbi:MAG: hypothetical protein ABIH50_06630 [bacterium]